MTFLHNKTSGNIVEFWRKGTGKNEKISDKVFVISIKRESEQNWTNEM